jgi:hypothetical protein
MCEDLYKNQFDAEERQLKKQRELEETITKLRKQIKELKK